jgi:hypothetical protein
MRLKLLICCVLIPAFCVRAQSRVAIDFNSALDNFFTTALYCHVLKKSFYFKTGLSAGNYGAAEVWNNDRPVYSPHSDLNSPPFPEYQLVHYVSRNKGQSLELGIGKFWEIDPIHTIRFDLQWKGYHIRETVWGGYISATDTNGIFERFQFSRYCTSIGPELFHAIRLTGRLTFYYGIKAPFFLPFRTKKFHPSHADKKDPTIGFQPQLALGLSCALERKKKTKE